MTVPDADRPDQNECAQLSAEPRWAFADVFVMCETGIPTPGLAGALTVVLAMARWVSRARSCKTWVPGRTELWGGFYLGALALVRLLGKR